MDSTIISQLIGKQFLLDEANFIGAFNPHNTSTYDSTIEATVSTTSTIYILPLSHFQEPTETEFMNISKLTDFASFIDLNTTAVNDLIQNQQKKVFAKSAVATPANISITLNQGVRTISLSNEINFTPYSIGFEALSTDQIDFDIFNDAFAIIKIQETKTNKTYTDLPGAEQLILIPASILAAKKLLTIPEYANTVTNYPVGSTLLDTTFTEPFQLDKAQSEGVQFVTKDSTGKEVKCYMTGGYTMTNSANSTPTSYTADDSIYVSEVLNDGTLAGFTKIGIHPFGKLTNCGVHVTSKCVYIFGGRSGASVLSASIYKANINADGTIGVFSIIGTLPVAQCRLEYRIGNENFIYIIGGYTTTTLSVLYTYKINEDTTLTLLATAPLTFNSYSSGLYFRDTPTVKELYTFGGYLSGAGGHQKIMRIPLDLVTGLPETPIEVGSIAGGTTGYSAVSPVSDSDNIYLLGGWVNALYYTKDVRKISLATLFAATNASKCTMTLDSWKLPFNIKYTNGGSGIETSRYLYFMCFDIAANSTTAISPSSSSARVFKFKKSARVSDLKIQTLKASFSTDNKELLKNKLYQRYYLEHLSNLVEKKRNQTSFTYNNINISFKDPVTNIILTLKTPTKLYFGINEDNKLFLEWLNLVCKNTNFDDINNYQDFTNVYGLAYLSSIPRSSLKFNIPELFLFMLLDINFYNLLLTCLTNYKIDYPTELDIGKNLKEFMGDKALSSSLVIDYPNSDKGLVINTGRISTFKKSTEKINYIFTPLIKNFIKNDEVNIDSVKSPLWSHYSGNGQMAKYSLKDGVTLPLSQLVYLPTNTTYSNSGKMDRFEYSTTTGNPSISGVHLYNAEIYFNNNGVETNLRGYITGLPFRYDGSNAVIISKDGVDILKITTKSATMLSLIYNVGGKYITNYWNCGYFLLENLNKHFGAINRVSYNYGSSTIGNPGSMTTYANGVYVKIPHDPKYTGYNDVFTGKTKTGTYYISGLEDKLFEQVQAEIPYTLIPLSETDDTVLQFDNLSRINLLEEVVFKIN